MIRKALLSAARILFVVLAIVGILGCVISQPVFHNNPRSSAQVDAARLKAHVSTLCGTFHPRDSQHPETLVKCADYIARHFAKAGAVVDVQEFDVDGRQYRNVIGRFGVGMGTKVVVGAHYDTCGDTPGADDNASGIAALIELAYLTGKNAPGREVELVAYVLEEPPYFRTRFMGSAIHAKSIADAKARVAGVIVLEMVGCFKDELGSQAYPSVLMRLVYPNRGNFVAVVGRWDQGDWIKAVKRGMQGTTDLPIYSIRAPSVIPGIDYSDHLNYWPYGIKAVMITDTSFYRNRTYHTSDDTPDQLDYRRMSQVVVAVSEVMRTL